MKANTFNRNKQEIHGLLALLCRYLTGIARITYKLCMMMRRCQDGTAPQYLAVHWSPVSETTSRQPHMAGPSTWN